MQPDVDLNVIDACARITLNRPSVGNAINLAFTQKLLAAADQCDGDSRIRCVILTGAGRMFCAGGDIGEMNAAGDRAPEMLAELAGMLHASLMRFAKMQKPILVAVNGAAAGAGMSLALCGDIVLCAKSAHFTAGYGAIGLTPDGGMTWMLPRLVGLRRAQEMILLNRRVKADEALSLGLVTRVVDDGALQEEVAAVAATLTTSATRALGGARALLLESFSSGYELQLEREARSIAAAGSTAESREGIKAFFEKRKPKFSIE